MADIDYLKWILQLSPLTRIAINHSWLWTQAFYVVTYLLNFLMLATWVAPPDPAVIDPDVTQDW
jgi:hypothetical protein